MRRIEKKSYVVNRERELGGRSGIGIREGGMRRNGKR